MVIGGVLVAAVGAYLLSRGGSTQVKSAATATAATAGAPAQGSAAPAAAAPAAAVKSPADADEKVDALMEKAEQAMQDRHFIDPAAGSALSLYREVLVLKPDSGEARQGLQRLSEILIARVQAALDDRKFDVALQFLETARSIDANDKRLVALDAKMASLRAELGPARFSRRSMRRISTALRSSSMKRRAPRHCRPRNSRNCATRCIGGATSSRWPVCSSWRTRGCSRITCSNRATIAPCTT